MRLTLALAAVVIAGPALAQPAEVAVSSAWARASTPGATTGAIYATVTASQPDRLTGVSTPAADKAELHHSEMVKGVMEMRAVPGGLPVTPAAPVRMAPGAYHIMLTGLKQPLKQGATVPVTFTFEHAKPITAQAVIAGPGASAPPR